MFRLFLHARYFKPSQNPHFLLDWRVELERPKVYSVVLILFRKLLECTPNSSIRIEVLPNHTIRRKRSANLLADCTDVPVLCELTADGALLAEDRCTAACFFDAGRRLKILVRGLCIGGQIVLTVCLESSCIPEDISAWPVAALAPASMAFAEWSPSMPAEDEVAEELLSLRESGT